MQVSERDVTFEGVQLGRHEARSWDTLVNKTVTTLMELNYYYN